MLYFIIIFISFNLWSAFIIAKQAQITHCKIYCLAYFTAYQQVNATELIQCILMKHMNQIICLKCKIEKPHNTHVHCFSTGVSTVLTTFVYTGRTSFSYLPLNVMFTVTISSFR
ncbi:hypothetical protein BsWGS_15447 [Bradybaena similaris]